MSDIFELKELAFAYPAQKTLLSGINLSISNKDKILLTGENGSGKSTLLKLLVGLLKPLSGSVLFHGTPIETAKAQTFRSLIFLLQNARENLFGLSPRHDLQLWQIAHPESINHQVAEQIVSLYRDKWNSPYSTLSDGEIRALLMCVLPYLREQFWILDEPFVALDAVRKRELMELMAAKAGGLLVVSHGAEEHRALFDRVLCLNNGTLREL
ncbi:MAG: ATP-binding cassette domain-containing protein [Candidatus Cloacimonadaceae bacterium]|nr:ATP-binding cassette domain-containing protein [Candidatus Cloacimonadaceae bacterium]